MNTFLRALPRVLLWILCGIVLSAVFFLVTAPPRGSGVALAPAPSPAPILVQVEGAVAQPGLYPLPRESRVEDALRAAGGLTAQADFQRVNRAARLKDGEKLTIPALGEPAAPEVVRSVEIDPNGSAVENGGGEAGGITQPINLNTATVEELDALPGIGPTRAQDIITYREQRGGFKSIDELQQVSGIGPATFERLKAFIFVE